MLHTDYVRSSGCSDICQSILVNRSLCYAQYISSRSGSMLVPEEACNLAYLLVKMGAGYWTRDGGVNGETVPAI